MAEPGLTARLRQHSRRSGMMVGFSMAIVIAIVIAGFIWTYLRIGPFLSDFIPANEPPTAISQVFGTPASGEGPGAAPAPLVPTPTAVASPAPQTILIPTPTPTPVWRATHEIDSDGVNIRLRGGPSTSSQIIDSLPPGTALQFLGEQQPSGGETWMKFETRDGKIGWVRRIDVAPIGAAAP
ncbi:MAG TPA: SH3 domain-containing protein [Thermomicrobiaceae bacterium]|nr:SH3 domain-containing protein [Thermomicrobiaceae bacterium]